MMGAQWELLCRRSAGAIVGAEGAVHSGWHVQQRARAAAFTADSRRRTAGAARSHSTVRRSCAKRGASD
jgi:hypothetical protein